MRRSQACKPLKFTDGLGGALAGRPIAIRYVDNRDLGRQAGSRDARPRGALRSKPLR